MPKLKREAPAQDPIEHDFLDAIERLRDGQPRHKKLKAQTAKGTLKLNFTNVAMEAGRARTLIALEENCRYPRVRELVKQAKAGKTELPTTNSELIERLRADKAELAADLKMQKATTLEHFNARCKAEKEAEAAKATAARLTKQLVQAGKMAVLANKESK